MNRAEVNALHFERMPSEDPEHPAEPTIVGMKLTTLGCTAGFRLPRHLAIIALAELLVVLAPARDELRTAMDSASAKLFPGGSN